VKENRESIRILKTILLFNMESTIQSIIQQTCAKATLVLQYSMWTILIKEELKCEALVSNYGTLGSFQLVSSMR
jgi:hypothetical protein